MNAWSGNEAIVAAWVPLASGSTLVDVIAEDGRLLEQQQVASATGRASFSTASLTAGTYLVRITNGANTRVFRLPVVH
jgi:predicted fused transcriptional regulator/phosphomethylpyrimidine kinase